MQKNLLQSAYATGSECNSRLFAASRFFVLAAVSVYYRMMRDRAAFMSRSTFYLYARAMGLSGLHRFRKPKKRKIGIRASETCILFFFIAKRKESKEKLVAGYGFRENKRSAPTGYNSSLRSSNRHPDNSSPLRFEKIISAARIFSDPKTIYGDIVR